jgi:serine/threonine-protein kinase
MDFGVARDTVGTRLTSTDEILGTPHYMAPEQLKGGAVDARADLYSLGAILYERLAGELPYPDDLTVTLTMKLTEPMPPLRYLRPDIPPRVEKVLMRMLEMEADHRYPTAREARIALEQAWARDLESARR